jgi:hypothetical protein
VRVRHGCTAIFPPSALFPGISRRCTWRVGATSVHPRSARAPSFGVRLRIHPHKRAHCPVRNTFTRALRTASAASAQPRLSPGAPAPRLMHLVRPRYSSCIPSLLDTAQALMLAPTGWSKEWLSGFALRNSSTQRYLCLLQAILSYMSHASCTSHLLLSSAEHP